VGETAAIVLAAGKSTRMKSDLPKVLHEVCGRPMLSFVLTACRLAGADRLVVVVGHGRELVQERFRDADDITWVEQREQRGTGHAVLCCRESLKDFRGNVLVIAGDMPLVRRETLSSLLEHREQSEDALTLATTVLDDPTGYGRILRDAEGAITGIVEHRDASEEELRIREVNPSYYCFDARRLWEAIERVQPSESKGEYYITDTVTILRQMGRPVSAIPCVPAEDAMGINSRLDLATVGRVMQDRIQLALMEQGVTIVDPDNTWIDADATIGADTVLYPFSYVGAGAKIGDHCRIGPFSRIGADEEIPDGTVLSPTPCGAIEP
jgi:bifunctional UDP-N-acetylglucosamine pyrophosphorylase/glucosamine-1-phosphate N-acetyltransferase